MPDDGHSGDPSPPTPARPIPRDTRWQCDAATGSLTLRTGVTGPAARLGHRLDIDVAAWSGEVRFGDAGPSHVALNADLTSLAVRGGTNGIIPLTPPEAIVARANALKMVRSQKLSRVRFTADSVHPAPGGFRVTGELTLRGVARPHELLVQVADEVTEEAGLQVVRVHSTVGQADFGIKPYRFLLGAVEVADTLEVDFTATFDRFAADGRPRG